MVYKKNVLAAGRLRRENADIALGYKNPKWLAPTIFESYLRSESEKMSFNKGAEIRKYLFLKMKNHLIGLEEELCFLFIVCQEGYLVLEEEF